MADEPEAFPSTCGTARWHRRLPWPNIMHAHGTVGYTSDEPPTTQTWQNFRYLGSLLFRDIQQCLQRSLCQIGPNIVAHLTPSCHLLPIRRQRPHPHDTSSAMAAAASGTKLEKTTRPQFAEAAFRGREKCTEEPTFHPRKAEHSGAHMVLATNNRCISVVRRSASARWPPT